MRLLELFSGTKSVGKAFEARGWEVVSVDLDAKTSPTHVADMLEWECPYRPGWFDHIHASPPCTEYSKAKTTGVRDLSTADLLVGKTLHLIMTMQPKTFTIENPVGLLRTREFMESMLEWRQTLCYCKYGMPYRKQTDIWSNMNWRPRPMCTVNDPCDAKEGNRHPKTAQRGPAKGGRDADHFTRSELYRIPQPLCEEWARAAEVLPRSLVVNEVAPSRHGGASEVLGPSQDQPWGSIEDSHDAPPDDTHAGRDDAGDSRSTR